jgi:tetratricopeptide (TPR) repeat protein
MTDCERLEARLVDLCDGALDADERAPLDAHLAGCAPCRAALEETRLLLAAYAEQPELDVSPELGASLVDAARQALIDERPTVAPRRPMPRWPLVLAAAALLAWFLVPSSDRSPDPAAQGGGVVAEWEQRGQELEHSGDLVGAEQVYRQALAEVGQDVPALRHRLGGLLLARQRFDEAADTLSALLDAHPAYAERDAVLLQHGEALVGLGRLREALASYRLVAGESPADRSVAEQQIQTIESLMLSEQLKALGYLGYSR